MALPSTPNFKAIIVGGSVAGLTLAHTFQRANIPYILLEARDTISPQLGASIVIMPNGARILDQMGLYEGLKRDVMGPMKKAYVWREDGRGVSCNEWPRLAEERLGYICGICERVEFLRWMYGQLKDKSKIHLSKKVVSIEHNVDSVTVKCADGTEYEGDVVIGADGIHSRTRREMQRFAKETGPKGVMERDENCITAQYSCIFGLSTPLPGLVSGDSHVSTSIDRSTLLFVGANSIPQFFFFSKLPQKYTSSSIPTFTKPQMLAQLKEFEDVHATDKVKLGDLVKNAKRMDGFALEEATFEYWTYGRVVCLGDAVHKMTPNLGQGGNQAIESAVVLTNCLVELLNESRGEKVKKEDLEKCLREYQDLRIRRAERFVKLSGLTTRNEALETLRHVLRFLFFPPLSGEILADIQTEMYHTAPYLSFLPLPERTKDNEMWVEGVERVRARKDVPMPNNTLFLFECI